MGIHLLCCTHSGEKTASRDVVQNVFIVIARNAKFHVLQKQIHVLPPPTLQSSHWRIDIVLIVNSVYMFGEVVIVNPTQVDLVSWTIFSRWVAIIVVIHAKDNIYCNQFSAKMFFLVAIEGFGCLHQQVDKFFH